MFSYIKSKVKISQQHIKPMIILVIISLMYALLMLFNTTTMTFEFASLTNSNFWVRYILVLSFSIVILFLGMVLRKDLLKKTTLITNALHHIACLRATIVQNGLYEEFRDVFIEKENRKLKLDYYRNELLTKRDKAKDKVVIAKYDSLYKETFEKDYQIDKMNVKIKEININLIFLGYEDGKNSKSTKYHYSGFENFIVKVVPTVLFGLLFTILLLSARLFPSGMNVQGWKDLIGTIGVSLSYLVNGLVYADYSINEVYYSVLCNREDMIKCFLSEKGLVAFIEPNPNHKFIATLEKKPIEIKPIESEVKNG